MTTQSLEIHPTIEQSEGENDKIIAEMLKASDMRALRLTMEIALGKRPPVGLISVLAAFSKDPGKIRPVNHVWLMAELKAAGMFDTAAEEFPESDRLSRYYLDHLENEARPAVREMWDDVFALPDFVPDTEMPAIS